ncbi:MAG: hypothetical protein AAGK37_03860 [Pseudomonadota bacterium]
MFDGFDGLYGCDPCRHILVRVVGLHRRVLGMMHFKSRGGGLGLVICLTLEFDAAAIVANAVFGRSLETVQKLARLGPFAHAPVGGLDQVNDALRES